jgi:hypothetical protein
VSIDLNLRGDHDLSTIACNMDVPEDIQKVRRDLELAKATVVYLTARERHLNNLNELGEGPICYIDEDGIRFHGTSLYGHRRTDKGSGMFFYEYPRDRKLPHRANDTHDAPSFCTNCKCTQGRRGNVTTQYECMGH